ncbi:MAG: YggS family pyridoxal phosphate-dependent enzyme [Pseudobdellovibrionaceae bacterium]
MNSLIEINSELKARATNQELRVVAVSKLQPVEKIRWLYDLGQRDFAENYAQEGLEKIEQLKDLKIRWHFIGSLQKNKVKMVVGLYDLIHSVDSLSLAEVLNRKASEMGLQQKILLQVNLSQEESKGGFDEPSFVSSLPELTKLKNISPMGLMTMPPLQNQPDENRIYFQKLKSLLSLFKKYFPQAHELSMGTSSDYLVAAEEGATLVRLGTILFGERPKKI